MWMWVKESHSRANEATSGEEPSLDAVISAKTTIPKRTSASSGGKSLRPSWGMREEDEEGRDFDGDRGQLGFSEGLEGLDRGDRCGVCHGVIGDSKD